MFECDVCLSTIQLRINNASSRNASVACDPDLFRMAGQVDLYHWGQDNLTDLCTPSCLASSSDWVENIHKACDSQDITTDSENVPASLVALRYSDGISLACLTDVYACVHECRTEQASQPSIMFFDNQTFGSDPDTTISSILISETLTGPATPDPSTASGTAVEHNDSTFKYCLLEAQPWTGVDIGALDCASDLDSCLCTGPNSTCRLVSH